MGRSTIRRVPLFASLALFVAGCGGGGDSTGGGKNNDPTAVVVVTGNTQMGDAGIALTLPLVVQVNNSNGDGVPNEQVSWVVTAGGGSLSSSTSQTDANGRAQVIWTVGVSAGQSAEARVAGVTAAVFTATVRAPCDARPPYAIGSTVNGALSTSDCALSDGSYIDYYGFTAAANASLSVTLTSGTFDTFLWLNDNGTSVLAVDDDGGVGANSSFRLILGAGSYRIGANSFDPSIVGAYALTSSTVASDVGNCADVWTTPGVSTNQTLAVTDCATVDPYYTDGFLITLRSGQAITVSMSSATTDALLGLVQGSSGLVVALDDDSGPGTDALMTYTASVTGTYVVLATTALTSQTGAYTLTIQ